MNTTFRCVLLVLYEAYVCVSAIIVYGSILCLLIGFMIYSKVCYLEIVSLFAQMDRLSERENSQRSDTVSIEPLKHARTLPNERNSPQRVSTESEILELCTEAVNLHLKLNTYGFQSFKIFRFLFTFLIFQTIR